MIPKAREERSTNWPESWFNSSNSSRVAKCCSLARMEEFLSWCRLFFVSDPACSSDAMRVKSRGCPAIVLLWKHWNRSKRESESVRDWLSLQNIKPRGKARALTLSTCQGQLWWWLSLLMLLKSRFRSLVLYFGVVQKWRHAFSNIFWPTCTPFKYLGLWNVLPKSVKLSLYWHTFSVLSFSLTLPKDFIRCRCCQLN